MKNKLFVGGISYNATDAQLEEHFAKIGKVLSAKIITDKYTGRGKGFGFVEMETEEDAKRAMQELNNTSIDGRAIVVKEAKPREDNKSNSYSSNNRW